MPANTFQSILAVLTIGSAALALGPGLALVVILLAITIGMLVSIDVAVQTIASASELREDDEVSDCRNWRTDTVSRWSRKHALVHAMFLAVGISLVAGLMHGLGLSLKLLGQWLVSLSAVLQEWVAWLADPVAWLGDVLHKLGPFAFVIGTLLGIAAWMALYSDKLAELEGTEPCGGDEDVKGGVVAAFAGSLRRAQDGLAFALIGFFETIVRSMPSPPVRPGWFFDPAWYPEESELREAGLVRRRRSAMLCVVVALDMYYLTPMVRSYLSSAGIGNMAQFFFVVLVFWVVFYTTRVIAKWSLLRYRASTRADVSRSDEVDRAAFVLLGLGLLEPLISGLFVAGALQSSALRFISMVYMLPPGLPPSEAITDGRLPAVCAVLEVDSLGYLISGGLLFILMRRRRLAKMAQNQRARALADSFRGGALARGMRDEGRLQLDRGVLAPEVEESVRLHLRQIGVEPDRDSQLFARTLSHVREWLQLQSIHTAD